MPVATEMSESLLQYQREINGYALLSVSEERELARDFRQGDLKCGHRLVTANLRFVVKVAYEYRSYGLKMGDLIQEGNIGLLKAVQKFDPAKEIRLISYAVWWIRAYIQNHILTNWSLVKMGTTQAQRKLFFSLARTRRELERLSPDESPSERVEEIAKRLNVRAVDVIEMQQRIGGHDLSLDQPIGDDDGDEHISLLESDGASPYDDAETKQTNELVTLRVRKALEHLDARERFVIEQRAMQERGMTLKELGEHFGVSRERARQLEIRAMRKLKFELESTRADLEGNVFEEACAQA